METSRTIGLSESGIRFKQFFGSEEWEDYTIVDLHESKSHEAITILIENYCKAEPWWRMVSSIIHCKTKNKISK